jgi:hypothetical protein
MQDLKFALRSLRKQPLFALVAVLTLALGIGANTAIFTLVYQTLLQPLPVANADRLVFVWNTYGAMNLAQASVSIPDYLDRKNLAAAVEDATLFTNRMANINEGGAPEQIRSVAVTPSFFSTLGVQPVRGRGFTEQEATPDADKFVILSYGFWSSHFAADETLVGRDIRINGIAYRVVGVMPNNFDLLGRDIGMFMPFAFTPAQMSDNERGNEFSQMIARLKPRRDSRAVRRSDEDDHRRRGGAPARTCRFHAHEQVRRILGAHSDAARRRHPHAAVHHAGLRAVRAVHRLRQRRQSAVDAGDQAPA